MDTALFARGPPAIGWTLSVCSTVARARPTCDQGLPDSVSGIFWGVRSQRAACADSVRTDHPPILRPMLTLDARNRLLSLLAGIGLVSGCTPAGGQLTPKPEPSVSPGAAAVRGVVTYRDRSALPPDARIEVWMVDVSPGIATMAVVAREQFAAGGRQVPIAYTLPYDTARIDWFHQYKIKAAISIAGQLRYVGETEFRPQRQRDTAPVNLIVAATSGSDEPEQTDPLPGTSWRLEDLGGAGVVDRVEATLEFSTAGRVAGRGSCNRFFGAVTIAGRSITFGSIGSTRMACPPAVSDQESKYFKALEQAQRFELRGSTLLITYVGSDKPLRFTRNSP